MFWLQMVQFIRVIFDYFSAFIAITTFPSLLASLREAAKLNWSAMFKFVISQTLLSSNNFVPPQLVILLRTN